MKFTAKGRKYEIWKPVVGFEGIYEVSNLGNVKSLSRYRKHNYGTKLKIEERLLTIQTDTDGYAIVGVNKNGTSARKLVHRLVANAFIPNPFNKPSVNHKNSIRTDNRIENLEWCTNKENTTHSITYGKFNPRGEFNKSSKINNEIVREIRSRYNAAHGSQQKIARELGISRNIVNQVVSGKTWRHVK